MNNPALSILYVDDEPVLLKVSKEYLESYGFIVDTAITGVAALDKISQNFYDAVIADYQMPGMNGIDLLKHIRRKNPDIPYILFTGKGQEEVVIEAIESGADFYVQKGGRPAPQFRELTHKVRIAVNRRKQSRTLADNELRYRALIQNSTDIIRILSPEGIILFNSPSSSRILGYPEDSLVGKNAFDYIHPEDRERVIQNFMDVNNLCNSGIPTEYRIRRSDGGYINVESTAINQIGVPGINGIITTTRQIDDRKQAEIKIRKMVETLSVAYEKFASTEKELREKYEELQLYQRYLAESEDRFSRFAANAQDLLYRMSLPEEKYEYLSPALESLTGYTPRDFYIDPELFQSMIHPSWKEYFQNQRNDLIKGIMPRTYEYQIIDRKGKTKWINQRNVLITDDKGKATAIEAIVTDVTEQKRIEEELRRIDQRFNATTLNAGFWVWEVDTEGLFSYVSPTVERILGYKPEELVGKVHFFDLFYESENENMKREAMTGYILQVPFREFLNLNRHKEGRPVMFRTSGIPIYTEDGDFSGYCGVNEDITRIKEAEERLRSSQSKYDLLAENVHDLIWTANARMGFTYISPSIESLLGFTVEEATMASFRFLLAPDSYTELIQLHTLWANTLQRGEKLLDKYRIDLEFRSKSGTPVWTEVLITPIYNDTGTFSGITGIARDISERRRVEMALKNANRQLSLLSGVTRHDILNTISAAYQFLELAERKETDPEVSEYLRMIMVSVNKIQDSIEFTRLYDELGVKEPEWFYLSQIIPDFMIPPHMNYFMDSDPVLIYADSMLEKVFLNLFDNSLQHGGNITEIRLKIRESESNLKIIWEDNGSGIPDEEKKQIFERGFGKNNGFGLFLAREILALTNISIAEIGRYGEGACFEITVPSGSWYRD